MPGHVSKTNKVEQADELNLSPQIRERLLAMQNKGIDLNKVLEELLDQREKKIQQEKITLQADKEHSRYIPVKIQRVLKQEYGSKCAHSNCTNVSVNIHHQIRFALDPRHNPMYLLPLCKLHHEIAHVVDQKSIQKRNQSVT